MKRKTIMISSAIAVLGVILTIFLTTEKSMSDNKNTGANNPNYEITVKQLGKELGVITIELFPEVAPKHVANFDSLVKEKFYDGCAFHRVIPGFMIQGGDPNSKTESKERWGFGSPDQTRVPAEFNNISHKRGIISAARSQDPNSASSQFFICVADASFLDKQYTVFGQVLSGMDIADKVVNMPRDKRDNPNDKVEMFIKKIK